MIEKLLVMMMTRSYPATPERTVSMLIIIAVLINLS
jgi:hypothetical protein